MPDAYSQWERNEARKDIIEVEYQGQKMCLADAAALAGIPYRTAKKRVRSLGWSVDRALSEPVEKRRRNKCHKD